MKPSSKALVGIAALGLVLALLYERNLGRYSNRGRLGDEHSHSQSVPDEHISTEWPATRVAQSLKEETPPGNVSPPSEKPVAALTEENQVSKRNDEQRMSVLVREEATREVEEAYSLIIDLLALTKESADALRTWLIEARIASQTTEYSRGRVMRKDERAQAIARIIGDSKLSGFLMLERNVREYYQIYKIGALLKINGAPIGTDQRDALVNILIQTRENVTKSQIDNFPGPSIDVLEKTVGKLDEYERLVMELAPSVLSSKQVQYLSDHYQYQSEIRAQALDFQKEQAARNKNKSSSLGYWYPAQ